MTMYQRGTITSFVTLHQRSWTLIMALATIAYVALSIRGDLEPGSVPAPLDTALSLIFVAEFTVRCWDAPSRRLYIRGHWLDLVSCLPMVGFLRALRLLRLVRLGSAGRIIALTEQEVRHRGHSRNSLWFLGPCVIMLWVGCAYAAWVFEHGSNPHLASFGDALYWSFITATTVGYGDLAPITVAGRMVAGLDAFMGIGLLALASAQLTALWLRQEDRRDPTAMQLEALRLEMAELRQVILERC